MPRRLDLSDKAVELMAFLSLHPHVTEDQIVAAVWPNKSRERGVQLLAETVTEVNRVVARATGNLTPAIEAPGQFTGPSPPGLAPRVLVRLMVPEPYVEVYDPDELLPP
ncbi:MAG: hypothetical protein ACRDZW_03265 [Acidimicrobiales bacterium]